MSSLSGQHVVHFVIIIIAVIIVLSDLESIRDAFCRPEHAMRTRCSFSVSFMSEIRIMLGCKTTTQLCVISSCKNQRSGVHYAHAAYKCGALILQRALAEFRNNFTLNFRNLWFKNGSSCELFESNL